MEKRIPVLTRALQDEDVKVRQAAARALELIESRLEFDYLIKAYKEGDKVEKLKIIHAMADIKDPRTITLLTYSLKLPEPELRAAAMEILGDKEDPRVVPFLIEGLKDPEPSVQIHAVQGLANFPDKAVVDILCELTTFATGELLEKIVDSLRAIKHSNAESYLLNLMENPDPRIRFKTALALGELDPETPAAGDAQTSG